MEFIEVIIWLIMAFISGLGIGFSFGEGYKRNKFQPNGDALSVSTNEEAKEVCRHQTLLVTRDPNIFCCNDCGMYFKGKLIDSDPSKGH